ncbi:MAG: phosphopantothenoylcysteine decarboxylase, partial [Carnobacterium sp.]
HQFLIGFAAETNNVEEYALGKLKKKKANLIVANDVSKPDAGFNKETNAVTIYSEVSEPIEISVRSKLEIAKEILNVALSQIS